MIRISWISAVWPLVSVLIVVSCASTKPYQATVELQMLRPREPPYVTNASTVVVVAFPIVRENLGSYGEIARVAKWTEMNRVATGVDTAWRGTLPLVPLPAFQIHILNQTAKPVSLAQTQLQVEDDSHRIYPPLTDPVSIKGRFVADMHGMNESIANDRNLMEALLREIHQLRVVSPSVLIQPGEKWVGYLVLNTNAHNPEEYRALMSSIQSFSIRFRNLPSGTETKDVELFVDKVVRPIVVTCPWDVKQPSLEKCTPDEAAAKRPSQALAKP